MSTENSLFEVEVIHILPGPLIASCQDSFLNHDLQPGKQLCRRASIGALLQDWREFQLSVEPVHVI